MILFALAKLLFPPSLSSPLSLGPRDPGLTYCRSSIFENNAMSLVFHCLLDSWLQPLFHHRPRPWARRSRKKAGGSASRFSRVV